MGKWRSWMKRSRLKICYIRNTVGSIPTLPTILIFTRAYANREDFRVNKCERAQLNTSRFLSKGNE